MCVTMTIKQVENLTRTCGQSETGRESGWSQNDVNT